MRWIPAAILIVVSPGWATFFADTGNTYVAVYAVLGYVAVETAAIYWAIDL